MPELIKDGPNIPISVMNELDDGRVVFFCGAGVSMGPGSNLPSFCSLVMHVYDANGLKPNQVERMAINEGEYDKALELLERPERLGVQKVRRTVVNRLCTPPTGQLVTHKALIKLSSTGQSTRLVTTNFDDRFVEACVAEHLVDVAPKLPLPKRHDWSSVVHLHGRAKGVTDKGSNLVLTAADFGRAYLTERWAARFVAELFREFTVVFVGYGLGDRVMGYLVDGLAAERAKGARCFKAYAFAPYCDESNREEERVGWLVKNVEPILYDLRDRYRLLTDTLVRWAHIKTHPFHARAQIVRDEMAMLPDDPSVERVTWALQDPVTAKTLSQASPTTKESDYPKIGRWLERFDQACLLSRPEKATDASPVPLVGYRQDPPVVDAVTENLARWMARHLHVPQVLAWVLEKGGRLHPVLRDQLRRNLAQDAEIPPKLRLFWTILSSAGPVDHHRFLFTSQHLSTASDEERRRIAEQAIASMAPRLVVRSGPEWQLRPEQLSALDSCGHLELQVGKRDERHLIEPVLSAPDVLSRYAETLTGFLERALVLLDEVGIATPSFLYRRSIAEHDQNRYNADWAYLVDLVRDSYLVVAAKDRARARTLFDRWMLSKKPLFKRLALHALTEDPKSDIRGARRLLLSGRWPGLWNLEMRREVLRFLRVAGSRLPRTLRVDVVRAIRAGPKSNTDHSDQSSAMVIRLHKLASSGAPLDRKSRELADRWQPSEKQRDDDQEFVAWSQARWVGLEEFAPRKLLAGKIADVVDALHGNLGPRQFMSLAIQQLDKAVAALRELAASREWPPQYWEQLLAAVAHLRQTQNDNPRDEEVSDLLVDAPDELFSHIGPTAASFTEHLAKQHGVDQEHRFGKLWHLVWKAVRGAEDVSGDPVSQALNDVAGRLAQAAVERLWKYQPRVGEGLPANVHPYFDKVANDQNGRPGRVVFATHLYSLFMIDRDWTQRNIISRLGPSEPSERYALWSGYAVSARIGPNLQAAFEEPFIEMLKRYDQVHDPYNVLIKLLVMICIDSPSPIEPTHVHQVIATLSDDALEGVLEHFVSRLIGDNNERAQIWCKDVQPWLEEYWPREGARNSALTADTMLKLIMQCGSAFPDAVRWALDTEAVQPSTRLLRLHGLRGGDCDYITQYPDDVLQLIAGVTANMQSFSQDIISILHPILCSLKKAKPELVTRTEFQSLVSLLK